MDRVQSSVWLRQGERGEGFTSRGLSGSEDTVRGRGDAPLGRIRTHTVRKLACLIKGLHVLFRKVRFYQVSSLTFRVELRDLDKSGRRSQRPRSVGPLPKIEGRSRRALIEKTATSLFTGAAEGTREPP